MMKSAIHKLSAAKLAAVFALIVAAPAMASAIKPGETPNFMNVVVKGDPFPIHQIIWMLLIGLSIASFSWIIDSFIQIKREKLLPSHVVDGVRACLQEGDLEGAIATCEENPGQLSNILLAGFSQITEGFDVIQETITKASELETEKILQRLNFLNVFGQMGPMLGLMGTVTGMISAFSNLGTQSGAGKSAALAVSIAGALWATTCGLLISIPSLLGYTVFRNQAIKIIIETEQTVIDLIKTLRKAEVATEQQD